MANNLAAFNAQAWSKRLVQRLNQINVMLGLVNKDYEGELQGQGDTVWVRTPGDITMGAYTKGQTISYQDLAPTKEQFQVSDAQYFAFLVDDVDKAQNDINAMDAYMTRAVVALNNTIETKLLAQSSKVLTANKLDDGSGGAITLTASKPATGADTSVYHQFVRARTALRKQNVPLNDLFAIVDPGTLGLLLEDTSHFVRATEFGDRVVIDGTLGVGAIKGDDGVTKPGFVGRCAGFDVYESTALPTTTTGSPAVTTTNLLFGDDQLISYAAQITEMEALRLQNTFANAVRGLLLHDATVFAECSKRGATVKIVVQSN